MNHIIKYAIKTDHHFPEPNKHMCDSNCWLSIIIDGSKNSSPASKPKQVQTCGDRELDSAKSVIQARPLERRLEKKATEKKEKVFRRKNVRIPIGDMLSLSFWLSPKPPPE